VKRKFNVPQNIIQNMISGEVVVAPQKYLSPDKVMWKSHLMLAGNDFGQWNDSQNNMGRRFVTAHFNMPVPGQKNDPNLQRNILSSKEHARLIFKSNLLYRRMASHDGVHVTRLLPPYFAKTNADFRTALNPIIAFLKDGVLLKPVPRDDRGRMTQYRYCRMFEVGSAFKMYCQNAGIRSAPTWTPDMYMPALKSQGLTVLSNEQMHWGNDVKVSDWLVGYYIDDDGGVPQDSGQDLFQLVDAYGNKRDKSLQYDEHGEVIPREQAAIGSSSSSSSSDDMTDAHDPDVAIVTDLTRSLLGLGPSNPCSQSPDLGLQLAARSSLLIARNEDPVVPPEIDMDSNAAGDARSARRGPPPRPLPPLPPPLAPLPLPPLPPQRLFCRRAEDHCP
jgi:hypothetical protein